VHGTYMYSPTYSYHHPATSHFYTLSLHDALPICCGTAHLAGIDTHMNASLRWTTFAAPSRFYALAGALLPWLWTATVVLGVAVQDRKSTRLNSSHVAISYAVFCLNNIKVS